MAHYWNWSAELEVSRWWNCFGDGDWLSKQIAAERDLLETGPSVTWRAMTFQLSPLVFCPDTSPDSEDNDAGQPAARGGEHPVCSGG
jgi:hypothetical protein